MHIQVPGKQYPAKLSTKREEPPRCGTVRWPGRWSTLCSTIEESTNINPHNGQPYVNRYLERWLGRSIPAPPQPMMQPQQQQQPMAVPTTGLQPQQQPQQFGNLQPQQMMPPQPVQQQPIVRHEVVTDDQREQRIMRQAATKVAAAFLPSLAEEDQNLGSLIRISEQLLKYYREGVSWETAPPPVATHESVHAGNEPSPDPGREQGDPGPGDGFPEGY